MIQAVQAFRSIENRLIKKPVLWIFVFTFVANLPAVFFSRGYGMHDDHFGPIEQPWAVINNPDIWNSRTTPHAHSIFYPLLHYVLFKLLYKLGVFDPQSIMLVVRFLHSVYSIITPIFIFKILSLFFEKQIAFRTTILLPFLWFIPFLSVRNLIEMVCIPPMAIGFFFFLKSPNEKRYFVISGLFFALAFAFRYQTLIISGTIFLILIFQKKFKFGLFFALSFLFFAFLIQGSVDIFAWGYPFASFIEYVRYNLTHSGDYTTGPIYRYLLLLLGVFTFPLSIYILYFFVKDFSKYIYIALPIISFFILHSIFPNKQERFILPIVPFVFSFGLANFLNYIREGRIFSSKQNLFKLVFILFWFMNLPLLVVFSLNYGKKTRCEALYYLSKIYDVKGVYQVTGSLGTFFSPKFYLNKYGTPIVEISKLDSLKKFAYSQQAPNYAIFYSSGYELDSLKLESERILNKRLVLLTKIDPSLADWILFKLNPKFNKNQVAFIYRIE